MAKLSILAGSISQSVTIFIQDSSSTTGAGKTGLLFNTASLVAYYTFSGATTTAVSISLATLATVTTAYSSGGFIEIDATNMPGLYRLDLPNAALAASKGRSCVVMLKGAANMAPLVLEIELTAVDNQSPTWGITYPTNFGTLIISGAGHISNVDLVSTVTTVTNQLTAAAIATGVWQDSTAGDFTAASSIGKSLYTSGVVPGGTNGLFIAGTNAATTVTTALTTTFTGNLTGSVASVTGAVGSVTGAVGSVTGAVGSVTGAVGSVTGNVGGSVASVVGLTASNLDTTVSSRMATYAQPTGFLAATFPTGTVANTTNITAGTMTTTTNLTNAPTSGDFTATMKTSIGTAVAASAVASVTGNVGGNVVGSVGSVTGSVGSVTGAVGSVTGAVGSVTGAVGSVTGNVGGNVTGSVGSVAGNVSGSVASVVGAVGSVTGNVSGSVASVVAAVGVTSNRKKGSTATFEFLMQDSSTGAPKTGLTVASTISKDGGTSVNTANAVTEIGLGQYQIVLTGTEMTANNIFLQFIAASALTANLSIQTAP